MNSPTGSLQLPPNRHGYDQIGKGYAGHRCTEPRIAQFINNALGSARTVLNVGAGTGSYEPTDRFVLAIEPSAVMRSQRPRNLAPAVIASAEALPFDENSFDAAMALLTVHHWPDLLRGLQELRRVAKGPVLIFTFDPNVPTGFWIDDYLPELSAIDSVRFPAIETITGALGGNCKVEQIPVPGDCIDGIIEAFYGRPEAFLDPSVRQSQSVWHYFPPGVEEKAVQALAHDLESGDWDRRYGEFRKKPFLLGALRLITAYS